MVTIDSEREKIHLVGSYPVNRTCLQLKMAEIFRFYLYVKRE